MLLHLEVGVGRGEEQLPLDEVDLVGAAPLAVRVGVEVAADDQGACPQVVVEAEHHRVTRLHGHVYERGDTVLVTRLTDRLTDPSH